MIVIPKKSSEQCSSSISTNVTMRVCPICESYYNVQDRLVCIQCDASFAHMCLDPNTIESQKILCKACSGYDSDVSSTVELEGCDGFVIEQHKNSIENACFEGIKHVECHEWSVGALVFPDDNLNSTSQLTQGTESIKAPASGIKVHSKMKFLSTFHVKPLNEREIICLDALTISGYKRRKALKVI